MIDALTAIASMAGSETQATPGLVGTQGPTFAEWLRQQVVETNEKVHGADRAVERVVAGEATHLHEVMFAIQRASLSLELVVQVRDRLLEAYQEVSRMQL